MIKKKYNISGFDCANCAAKAEAHLNKDKRINYARLDFAGNRLYITFEDKELSIDEIKQLIAEVESDPIEINSDSNFDNKVKLFNKKMWFLLARIIFATIICVICFILNQEQFYWLRFSLYLVGVIVLLYDIVFKVINHIIHRENIIDHNLLITISSIGAFVLASLPEDGAVESIIDEHFEAVMVVLLFQIGRIIESYATNKSKAAIMSAVQLRIEYANLERENELIKVKPEELKIDDIIVIKNGELIPTDCEVIEGDSFVDTSSLTGEYIPVKAEVGTMLCSGCLIKSGNVKARVKKVYEDSTVAKIINLISEGGEKKSKADEFIAKFAKFYTPIVCLLAILATIIGGLITKEWNAWVMIGLEILVTGCPCAIIISVPLVYFSAIGLSSKHGIVVKGTNYLDLLNNMGKLITDKTGTLTHGSFSIQEIKATSTSKNELLDYLYAAECLSNHPIGKAICHGQNLKKLASEQVNFKEYVGLGVYTEYNNQIIIAGNAKYMQKNNIEIDENDSFGVTIYCAVNNEYVGYVVLSDELKEDAQPMIDLLHSENVEIVLLTGDKEDNAKEICTKLGIDRWHSELMPEDKVKLLEYEMEDEKKSVAFIGDGINDAPSIIRSDIGIAMGGIGSDIAVENADVVIMNDDPAKVYDAMKIAKMARNTAIFNIVFALVIKVAVMILILLNIWPEMMTVAVFADTGLTVLLVLNSLAFLYRKVRRKRV